MDEAKKMKMGEETQEEQKTLIQWIREHKKEIAIAGISITACKLRSNGMPVPLLRNGYSIFNGTKYR